MLTKQKDHPHGEGLDKTKRGLIRRHTATQFIPYGGT